jgi:hypothetical protein
MMFFAGRPELALPPAPDTRVLALLRWMTAFLASATTVFSLGLGALIALEGQPWLAFMPLLLVPLLLVAGLFALFCDIRDRNEKHYWTPDRLRQLHPALWQLYCAGNPLSTIRADHPRGLPQ